MKSEISVSLSFENFFLFCVVIVALSVQNLLDLSSTICSDNVSRQLLKMIRYNVLKMIAWTLKKETL